MSNAIVPTSGMSLDQQERYREALRETHGALAEEIPENTRKAYDADFDDFRSWCDKIGFEPKPATEEAILGYMTHLAFGEKLKPATIRRRLFGITHHHRKDKLKSPVTPEVKQHLLKIRRNAAVDAKVKQAPPLLLSDLHVLVSAMNTCPPALREAALRDRAVLLLGWNCAMRRSEIVGLEVRDLITVRGKRSLVIRKSKTDQIEEGTELPLNPSVKHKELCPLRAVDAWLEFRGRSPGALFWKTTEKISAKCLVGSTVLRDTPMPWIQVNRMVTWWSMISGIEKPNGQSFSPHSMRAGYITETSLAGGIPNVIMARSRHKSLEVFNRYIRVELSHENDPTALVL